MADEYNNLTTFVQATLAQGQNIVFGDNDHTSALPRKIIGDPSLLQAIKKNGGTLILEGSQAANKFVQDFYDGKVSEETLRAKANSIHVYQSNDPAKAAERNNAEIDILINGKAADTHIFYPETGGFYQDAQNDPEGIKSFLKVAGEITSVRCAQEQIGPILDAMNENEKIAFLRISSLAEKERLSTDENHKIIENIKTKKGPYVGLYGDAHRAQITTELNAKSIGIIASEKDSYQGSISTIPEYIYYADSDRLLHIPEGSPERAEFMAKQVMAKSTLGDQTTSLGRPLTAEEAKACFDALPAEVRNHPVPFFSFAPTPFPSEPTPNTRPQLSSPHSNSPANEPLQISPPSIVMPGSLPTPGLNLNTLQPTPTIIERNSR